MFVWLGPDNMLVQAVLRAACKRHGVELLFAGNCIDIIKNKCGIRIGKTHMPYVLDLAIQFEEYFNPIVPEIVNGRALVDYSRPRLHRYKKSGLHFELSSIPEEESAIDAYFHWYCPKPGDIIFDVGAYCGVSTYHLSKLADEAVHVYAFEPDPANYGLLVRNIERHRLSNVTPLKLGIAGKSGSAEFYSEGALGSTLARSATRPPAGVVETIQTITFQEACKRFGVPAFAKVDIEGAEVEMLEAGRELLKSHAIQFAFDTNHYVNGAATFTAVERILRECGYEVMSSAASGFMTTWARGSVTHTSLASLPEVA
jgi:FkbM family methyltransferase